MTDTENQKRKILAMLKESSDGVRGFDLAMACGSSEFGARILELRKSFNCNHIGDHPLCLAREHIQSRRVNGKPKFFYWKDTFDKNEDFLNFVKKKKEEREDKENEAKKETEAINLFY